MPDSFDALAHPARRQLADELRQGPQRAGDLGTGLAMSREAVSKHLRAMVAGGVLAVENRGRERWYRLRPQALEEIDRWLLPYRQFWERQLDALEAEITHGQHDRTPSDHDPHHQGA